MLLFVKSLAYSAELFTCRLVMSRGFRILPSTIKTVYLHNQILASLSL